MATLVMLPDVVEMLSIMSTRSNEQFRIAEIPTGKSIAMGELDLWSKTNCTILCIKNPDNHYTINPEASYQIRPGERLIVMGSDEQISLAAKLGS